MNKFFKNYYDMAFFSALLIIGALFVYTAQGETTLAPTPKLIPEKITPDSFANINLTAEAALVYDIKTKETLFARNEARRMPLASLTKIFTAIAAREALSDTDVVRIPQDALAQEGDNGLLLDEAWNLFDLLALTLVSSSNDGAHATGEYLSVTKGESAVSLMNKKAQELGLADTYFLNESGLDESSGVSGGYSSAHDVTRMLEYALLHHDDLFSVTAHETFSAASLNYGMHTFPNTNIVSAKIPSLLISKTGFTDLAGGNLAIVFEKEPAHPIAVVVLGGTREGRFTDVEQLVWAAIQK